MIRPHDSLPYRHVLTLPAMGSAVRIARETTEQVLAEWGVGPQEPCTGPALLILSELVANSVRHAAVLSPKVTVIFAGGPDAFAFGVHDRHPYRPALYTSAVAGFRAWAGHGGGADAGAGRQRGGAGRRGRGRQEHLDHASAAAVRGFPGPVRHRAAVLRFLVRRQRRRSCVRAAGPRRRGGASGREDRGRLPRVLVPVLAPVLVPAGGRGQRGERLHRGDHRGAVDPQAFPIPWRLVRQ